MAIVQQDKPDYVIASGEMKSVREFIELRSELNWNKDKGENYLGKYINEIERADTGEIVVRVDPRYFRPTEVDQLLGDASRKKLGWKSETTLSQLISEMIKKDSNDAKKDYLLKKKGFPIYNSNE